MAQVRDSEVKIVKSDGNIGATNKADTVNDWPNTDTYKSYGGVADLWGEAWTAADINNANFGVVLSAKGVTFPTEQAKVDHIRITVYYTEAVGTNMKVNIVDVFKDIDAIKTNISDVWKDVAGIKINIGDVWKDVF